MIMLTWNTILITLKSELIYHHYCHNNKKLNNVINILAYIWYNQLKSHI